MPDTADVVVRLSRALRAAGVEATSARTQATARALDELDTSREGFYWAGRLTMCGSPEDATTYDRVFAELFGGDGRTPLPSAPPLSSDQGGAESGDEQPAPSAVGSVTAAASPVEVLRHRDIASLSPAEQLDLDRVLIRTARARRRARRMTPAGRGAVDRRRTVHDLLRTAGEPLHLAHRRRSPRARRVVLVLDVSGSMSAYADTLLRFVHVAGRRRDPAERGTEVFTLGTRLTRVTREMTHLDPDAMRLAVGRASPDWSGGTRLGLLLKDFLDTWGRPGMARGAVVVLLSDGWERGDVELLRSQMAALHRLAHRVIWANPRAGQPLYEPLAQGMAAALPYVDDFVSGHSLAALEHVAALIAEARWQSTRSRPTRTEVLAGA